MAMNLNYAALSAVAQAGIRRSEVTGLPKGWIREEIPRFAYGGGAGSKGGVEVVYYTPKGHTIKTKNEMAKALGDNYDLTAFDFQTGKINHALLHSVMQKAAQAQAVAAAQAQAQAAKLAASASRVSYGSQNNHHGSSNGGRKGSSQSRSTHHNSSSSSSSHPVVNGRAHSKPPAAPAPPVVPPPVQPDQTLVPPIRQTASIFKQPVTVEKRTSQEDPSEEDAPPSKTKPPSDLKSTSADKPRQLFWEKRLGGGLRASCPDEVYEPWNLPKQLTPVGPPGVEPESDSDDPPTMILASISTSLHLNGSAGSGSGGKNGSSGSSKNDVGIAVSGQGDAKNMRDKDPSVFCQPDQPLIAATKLTQTDVDKQEARVIATRKKLADAIAALNA